MSAERPIFGDSESIKEARTRPLAKKEVRPTEYDPLKVFPTIKRLIVEERERWAVLRREGLDRGTLAREILGLEEHKPIRPSIVSKCLRWWGYSELGYKPLSKDFNDILRMEAGIALHRRIEGLLSGMGWSEYPIPSLEIDDVEMSGTIDLLYKNPKTNDYQVIEFKTVSHEAFVFQLNREGIRKGLVLTKGIIAPRESDKKQVGLYLKFLEKKGIKVACANIIYIDRNTTEFKEALIPWDATTRWEVDQFIEQIKEAQKLIAQNELPEATVDSEAPCKYYCEYRHACDAGKRAVARRKKPRPKRVIEMTKRERAEKRKMMERLGTVQPTLGGDFEGLVHEEK